MYNSEPIKVIIYLNFNYKSEHYLYEVIRVKALVFLRGEWPTFSVIKVNLTF